MAQVFISGATGFIGRHLAAALASRGHRVRALVRKGSEGRVPAGCEVVVGDALAAASYRHLIAAADTFVQLLGVSHPSPAKAAEFRSVDLVAGRAAVDNAVLGGIRHFVYVSVAHPAPVMKDYIAVRSEVEAYIRASGLAATILRPWYVLGPGRRWPLLLRPVYRILEALPQTRESARRLGLVTLPQMVGALVRSVEDPPGGVRIWEVPQIAAANPVVS